MSTTRSLGPERLRKGTIFGDTIGFPRIDPKLVPWHAALPLTPAAWHGAWLHWETAEFQWSPERFNLPFQPIPSLKRNHHQMSSLYHNLYNYSTYRLKNYTNYTLVFASELLICSLPNLWPSSSRCWAAAPSPHTARRSDPRWLRCRRWPRSSGMFILYI